MARTDARPEPRRLLVHHNHLEPELTFAANDDSTPHSPISASNGHTGDWAAKCTAGYEHAHSSGRRLDHHCDGVERGGERGGLARSVWRVRVDQEPVHGIESSNWLCHGEWGGLQPNAAADADTRDTHSSSTHQSLRPRTQSRPPTRPSFWKKQSGREWEPNPTDSSDFAFAKPPTGGRAPQGRRGRERSGSPGRR